MIGSSDLNIDLDRTALYLPTRAVNLSYFFSVIVISFDLYITLMSIAVIVAVIIILALGVLGMMYLRKEKKML
jgi:hypothetical protein